jgi:GxxExxY protein
MEWKNDSEMTGSKEPKEPKEPKDLPAAKRPSGPLDLRISSPLPPELDQLVYDVIGAAMRVHSTYGPGLKENVYEDAFAIELTKRGIEHERQVAIEMTYEGERVRRFFLDLVVAKQIIVEVKAVTRLHPEHSSQMLTYLRLTQLPVGIILNFNERHLRNGIRRHVLRPTKSP